MHFIYLFKGSIRKLDSIPSNDLVIVKAERTWKETAMAKFKILSQHLLRRIVENHMKPLVRTVGCCRILTGHFPRTIQTLHEPTYLARQLKVFWEIVTVYSETNK
jgi:hypothetical protein